MQSTEFTQLIARPDYDIGRIYGYERETSAPVNGVRNASADPLAATLAHVCADGNQCFSTSPAGAAAAESLPKEIATPLAAIADSRTPQGSLEQAAQMLAAQLGCDGKLRALAANRQVFVEMLRDWKPDGDVTLVATADENDPDWRQLDVPRLLRAVVELGTATPPRPELCGKAHDLLRNLLSDLDIKRLQTQKACDDAKAAAALAPPVPTAASASVSASASASASGRASRYGAQGPASMGIPSRSVHQHDDIAPDFWETIAANTAVRMTRLPPVALKLMQACATERGRCAILAKDAPDEQRLLTDPYSYPQVLVYNSRRTPFTGIEVRDHHHGVDIVPDQNNPNRYAVFASIRKEGTFSGDYNSFVTDRSRPVAYIDRKTGRVNVLDEHAGPCLKVLLKLDDDLAGDLLRVATPQRQPQQRGVVNAVKNFFSKFSW